MDIITTIKNLANKEWDKLNAMSNDNIIVNQDNINEFRDKAYKMGKVRAYNEIIKLLERK